MVTTTTEANTLQSDAFQSKVSTISLINNQFTVAEIKALKP
jgi:hypothetical protein